MLIPVLAIIGVFALISLISVIYVKFGLDDATRADVSVKARIFKPYKDFKDNFKPAAAEDPIETKNR